MFPVYDGSSGSILADKVDMKLVLWAACAVVSVTTSKCLLVDLGLHFPRHLLTIQTVTAMIMNLSSSCIQRPNQLQPLSRAKSATRTKLQIVAFLLLPILPAISNFFTTESLLHFPNLPTISMLLIISCFWESLVTWILKTTTTLERSSIIPTVMLCVCSAGLLYGEYRLTTRGVACAMVAATTAGVSRSLHNRFGAVQQHETYTIVVCVYALLLSGYFAITQEQSTLAWKSLDVFTISLFVLNAFSSAFALLLGKSVLFFSHPANDQTQALGIMLLNGLVGCISVSFLQRSYTSWLQFGSLLLAVGIISRHGLGNSNISHLSIEDYELREDDFSLQENGSKSIASIVFEFKRSTSRMNFVTTATLFAVCILAWIQFVAENFEPRIAPIFINPSPRLDSQFRTGSRIDIVLSMFDEPVHDVAALLDQLNAISALEDAHVYVYTKFQGANITKIGEIARVYQVTQLPNIGREGETHLHHIIRNWDSLARHTLFLQAHVHNPRELIERIKTYFDPKQTGMLSLGFVGRTIRPSDEDQDYWRDRGHVMAGLFERIYGEPCQRALLTYKGQFIVSAARIRGIEKAVYEELHDAFVNETSFAHEEPYLAGRPDFMSAPIFGYTMERIWGVLFQCSDLEVAWKCPSLFSAKRMGGSIGDCQCFDT